MDDTFSVKNALVNQLLPAMGEQGFEWIEAFRQFRKKTSFGFQCVILSVSDYEDLSIVELHFGIRFDRVENLAFPYTNGLKGFSRESMTLVVPVGKLLNQTYYRWDIAQKEEVRDVTIESLQLINEQGLPFFKKYATLPALDELFNGEVGKKVPLLNNPIHRCIRGITIARLSQRADFDQLVKSYRQSLQELFAPGLTLKKYDELVRFLTSYQDN
jgi:hypothetical protein